MNKVLFKAEKLRSFWGLLPMCLSIGSTSYITCSGMLTWQQLHNMEDTQLPISGPRAFIISGQTASGWLRDILQSRMRVLNGAFPFIQIKGRVVQNHQFWWEPALLVPNVVWNYLELLDLLHTNLGWGLNLDAPNNVSFYSESSPSVVMSDV